LFIFSLGAVLKESSYLNRVTLDYSVTREDNLASAIVHMVGFGLNITGMSLLIVFSALRGSTIQVVSYSLFGAFHTLYYIFSVLFHTLQGERSRKVFRIFDLNGSYLILIGILTPLTLSFSQGTKGWFFFYLLISLNVLAIIWISINRKRGDLFLFIVNVLLLIGIAVFISLSCNEFDSELKLWLSISTVVYFLGFSIRYFGGIPYRHSLSHFFYMLGNLSLFFGFFFQLF